MKNNILNWNKFVLTFILSSFLFLPSGCSTDIPAITNIVCFSPEEFGAIGDGKSDDTIPIQKAINAAAESGGGIVQLKARNYIHSSIDIPGSGVTLNGIWAAGDRKGTELIYRLDTGNHIYITSQAYGTKVQRIRLSSKKSCKSGSAILISGNKTSIEDVYIDDGLFNGITISGKIGKVANNTTLNRCFVRAINGNWAYKTENAEIVFCRNISFDSEIKEGSKNTDGFLIGSNSDSVNLEFCRFLKAKNGIIIDDNLKIQKKPNWIRLESVATENCSDSGFLLLGYKHAIIRACYSHNNHRNGLENVENAGFLSISSGTTIQTNGQNGILFKNVGKAIISESIITRNSKTEHRKYSAILISEVTGSVVISGNIFGNHITKTKEFCGIEVKKKCSGTVIINSNSFDGGFSGPAIKDDTARILVD
ncbi:MAG: hypothetical protein GY874_14420 [Desulfobacteraceae bacterium]|nr:hypothetical protein [Desulfobacteraceae bacterium]